MADSYIPYFGPIVTRSEAKASGLKRYFVGSTCPQGHVAERFAPSGGCIACTQMPERRLRACAKTKAWVADNPERKKVQDKVYRAENRDKTAIYAQEYYEANKEKWALRPTWAELNPDLAVAYRKAYYEANKDAHSARSKLWFAENPEAARAMRAKRRARKRNAEGSHTADELIALFKRQKGKCAYCRCALRKDNRHADHITPLASGGTNWISNIQWTCEGCNLSKGAKHPADYARTRGLLL